MVFQQILNDRIKIILSGDCYQVLQNDGIFIETKNINNGYRRIFRRVDLLVQTF